VAKVLAITLDASSTWNVTGASRVTTLKGAVLSGRLTQKPRKPALSSDAEKLA